MNVTTYAVAGKPVTREDGPEKVSGKTCEGVSHVLDLLEGSSKLIPINEEPNHQIVHLFRLGKANCTTH